MKESFYDIYFNAIKHIINFIIGISIFILIIVLTPSITETLNSRYSMNGIITKIELDNIFIEDTTGNIWIYKDEGYNVNESVRIVFFNNYTDNTRVDDEILKIIKINKNH